MGIDILGWVEIRPVKEEPTLWLPVVDVGLLADRSTEMFSWLYGVRKRDDGFVPIAAERGLPTDVSDRTKVEHDGAFATYPSEFFGTTWATWAEIKAINWDERVEDHVVERRKGSAPGTGTVAPKSSFLQFHRDEWPGTPEELQPGVHWEQEDREYEVVETYRRDAIEYGWAELFEIMAVLAKPRGNDAVRMVVWFCI
jgi:hypothetical protein